MSEGSFSRQAAITAFCKEAFWKQINLKSCNCRSDGICTMSRTVDKRPAFQSAGFAISTLHRYAK